MNVTRQTDTADTGLFLPFTFINNGVESCLPREPTAPVQPPASTIPVALIILCIPCPLRLYSQSQLMYSIYTAITEKTDCRLQDL